MAARPGAPAPGPPSPAAWWSGHGLRRDATPPRPRQLASPGAAPPSPGVPDPVLAVAAWRGPGSPARSRGAPSPRRPRAAPLPALDAWPRAVRPRWLTGAAVRDLAVAARPRPARCGALPAQLARPWRGPIRWPWRLGPARLGVPRPCAAWPRPGAASARAAVVPLRSAARALLGPGVRTL
ncbi:hypothetical protein ZEAMMB73_Zm00001d041551 [Zea mays]|uniref:Uncharacterized protein n=1 Tax=Zea mays TaxID=4577 RepID=A0A1D6MWV3_MAIZE|nr:hypothetical protein ZEAMMB73_Zm00001d041551 [Zea mays]